MFNPALKTKKNTLITIFTLLFINKIKDTGENKQKPIEQTQQLILYNIFYILKLIYFHNFPYQTIAKLFLNDYCI